MAAARSETATLKPLQPGVAERVLARQYQTVSAAPHTATGGGSSWKLRPKNSHDDAECLGGMDVDGNTQLPDHPHSPGQDLSSGLIDIGYLVLDADVVWSKTGIQQILEGANISNITPPMVMRHACQWSPGRSRLNWAPYRSRR